MKLKIAFESSSEETVDVVINDQVYERNVKTSKVKGLDQRGKSISEYIVLKGPESPPKTLILLFPSFDSYEELKNITDMIFYNLNVMEYVPERLAIMAG